MICQKEKCQRCFNSQGIGLCCGYWSNEDELVTIDAVPQLIDNKGICIFNEEV